jgi:5'-nucleotidase
MNKNIIISKKEKFNKKKEEIKKGGFKKLHILSDFDRTLTKSFVEGIKVPSLISILRDYDYLCPEYVRESKELFEKYHPIEKDPNISPEDKKKAMYDWWTNHFRILIKYGLSKKDIQDVVDSRKVNLRDSFSEFNDILRTNNVPLIIMSSCGLGKKAIEMYLKKENELSNNIYIISNTYQWDENGKAVGVKEPIIHTMSKKEIFLKKLPIFDSIKERKNVVLLGDSLSDADMIEGFDYDNIIRIGFLNEEVQEMKEIYSKKYDVLITNDSSMEFVNELLKDLR